MQINNSYGIKAENYFSSIMNSLGIRHSFVDEWYDFIVNGKKVEVKSCELSIKQTKFKPLKPQKFDPRKGIRGEKIETYRSGRFHFTEKKNRILQYNNNIWVCFILRHKSDFMMLGFIKAKYLKKRKHICIHDLRKLKIITLDQWIKKINK